MSFEYHDDDLMGFLTFPNGKSATIYFDEDGNTIRIEGEDGAQLRVETRQNEVTIHVQ